MFFEGYDFSDFWTDSAYALKEYTDAAFTAEDVKLIEKELGYKLPESYVWLMQRHNGGIPVKTCYPTSTPTSWSQNHVAIEGIMSIGRDKSMSLLGKFGSRFWVEEWEYPDIGVAICDCPSAGHDMIFLDYRVCGREGDPSVVHIDQEYDYKITPLVSSFEEFIMGLRDEADFE